MDKAKGVFSETPTTSLSNVRIHSVADGKDAVLHWAGAILPSRDIADLRVVRDVKELTGRIVDTPTQVGGYPDYPTGIAAIDTDNDGMPDEWEKAHGIDSLKSN